jgi:hypothetical protein
MDIAVSKSSLNHLYPAGRDQNNPILCALHSASSPNPPRLNNPATQCFTKSHLKPTQDPPPTCHHPANLPLTAPAKPAPPPQPPPTTRAPPTRKKAPVAEAAASPPYTAIYKPAPAAPAPATAARANARVAKAAATRPSAAAWSSARPATAPAPAARRCARCARGKGITRGCMGGWGLVPAATARGLEGCRSVLGVKGRGMRWCMGTLGLVLFVLIRVSLPLL